VFKGIETHTYDLPHSRENSSVIQSPRRKEKKEIRELGTADVR
jgi:hypothetical protein